MPATDATHTFEPGDRFLWPAGNGRLVRSGEAVRLLPASSRPGGVRARWEVRVDPIGDVDAGGVMWLFPEEMFPLNTPASVLAAHVAVVQERWFGVHVPTPDLVRSLDEALALVREALARAFPEAASGHVPDGCPACAAPARCAVCGADIGSGEVECQRCAGHEDAAAKRAADV